MRKGVSGLSVQGELIFLREVLKKSHVESFFLDETGPVETERSKNKREGSFDDRIQFFQLFSTLEAGTLYQLTDRFACSYRLFLLPHVGEERQGLVIGPFLAASITPERALEIGEANGISPSAQRYLMEYYMSLPVLSAGHPLLIMIHTFCERMWGTPSYPIRDTLHEQPQKETPFSRSMMNVNPQDTLVNARAVERRYAFENEMIRAVTLGQTQMEQKFRSIFSESFFEKRATDPLRNAKNYGVIMNTLLRKAAESGGVHPVHLDQVSSEFAVRIESMASLSENSALMCDMFRTYCRLVRNQAMSGFSAVVQKTVLMIGSDLSADLSPATLAAAQGISLGYLSSVFKKETGKTLSAYIREKRMEYAAYLLTTTRLQVQSVAMHCGMMDVQYFSKLFKNYFGKSPTEYRDDAKKSFL